MAGLAAMLVALGATERLLQRVALAQPQAAPIYQVDPLWPQMPPQWILGGGR